MQWQERWRLLKQAWSVGGQSLGVWLHLSVWKLEVFCWGRRLLCIFTYLSGFRGRCSAVMKSIEKQVWKWSDEKCSLCIIAFVLDDTQGAWVRSSGADEWMLLKRMCHSIKTGTVLLHKGQKKNQGPSSRKFASKMHVHCIIWLNKKCGMWQNFQQINVSNTESRWQGKGTGEDKNT